MPDQSSAASEHALMQEITAPLETLPDDPLALVEADFPSAMRGYDRHAVDDYVEQISRLVAELQATRSPESAVRRALERVGDQISGILQRAHETAEQITAQSRAEAEDRMEQARREAAAILDAAEQRVRDLDTDTDRIWVERQRIVADAEDLSGQLLAIARDAAERFPADAVAAGGPEVAQDIEGSDAGEPDDGELVEELDPEETDEELDVEEVEDEDDDDVAGEPTAAAPDEDVDPGIERTVPYTPQHPAGPPVPRTDPVGPEESEGPLARRLGDEDSTQIIPPASDAAQHRRDG
jgi:DivIVA domain-containing protein